MTKDEFLKRFEQALSAKYQAQIQLQLLHLEAKLAAASPNFTHNLNPDNLNNLNKSPAKSSIHNFISEHSELLEPQDIQFLQKGEARTQEVSKFLTENDYFEISPRTVARKIGTWYRPGKSDDQGHGKIRMVDTRSVIERHLIYGNTEEEQER
jgi:hypothetical protein